MGGNTGVAVNVRRGLFRLWIIGSAVWFCGWLIYLRASCVHANETSLGDTKNVFDPLFCPTGFFGSFDPVVNNFMTRPEQFSVFDVLNIIGSGLFVPAIVLIIGRGTLWVFEGFGSRS
jgi:hypothetical protein